MPVTVWHFLRIYSLRPHTPWEVQSPSCSLQTREWGTERTACPRLPSQVVEPALKPHVHALHVQSERLSGGNWESSWWAHPGWSNQSASQAGTERARGGYIRADLLKASQLGSITALDWASSPEKTWCLNATRQQVLWQSLTWNAAIKSLF